MWQRFHFCACVGDCLSINEEQNFLKKIIVTLILKLKGLVTGNKSELDGEFLNQISHCLCNKNLGLY